ncbi:MAG: prefoldin subunit beta [Candidatus Methanofastidiosia archaeon]
MQNIPPHVQHELSQFQQLEQQYQMVLSQKQKVTLDLKETELALVELEKESDTVYKSIGSILVKVKRKDVVEELNERKGTLQTRMQTLERQEKRVLEKLKTMQEKIQKMLGASAG